MQFDRVAASAKEITLEVFATDESASVQVRVSALVSFARSFVCCRARSAPCTQTPPFLAFFRVASHERRPKTFRVANFLFGCGPNNRIGNRLLLHLGFFFSYPPRAETTGGKASE